MLAGIANILAAANRQRAGKRGGKPVVTPPAAKKQRTTRVLTVAQIVARQTAATNN